MMQRKSFQITRLSARKHEGIFSRLETFGEHLIAEILYRSLPLQQVGLGCMVHVCLVFVIGCFVCGCLLYCFCGVSGVSLKYSCS